MRRKVKRTLKVRTTETWTITWNSDDSADQPRRRIRGRARKMLPREGDAKGETENEMTTLPTQIIEEHPNFNSHS